MNATRGAAPPRPLYSRCGQPGMPACHVAFWIWRLVPVPLLCVGTITNVLSVLVLARKRLRHRSTSVYLICRSLTGQVFLLTGLLRVTLVWLTDIDLVTRNLFHCKVHEWIMMWSTSFGGWMLALLTVERVIHTGFPLFARRVMTKTYTACVVVISFVSLGLLNFPSVLENQLYVKTFEINDTQGLTHKILFKQCRPSLEKENVYLTNIWPTLRMTFYIMIPICIILTGNVSISIMLCKRRKKIQPMMTGQPSNKISAATKLGLIMSAYYLIAVVPYAVYESALSGIVARVREGEFAQHQLIYSCLVVMFCSVVPMNFVWFYISGSIFRTELFSMLDDVKTSVRNFFDMITSSGATTHTTG